MLILTIRTNKPEAEIGLFKDDEELSYVKWQAHRELAETIHKQIHTMLKQHAKDWQNIKGIVCFLGPGSFTGLRIGLTVGNALAAGLQVPIVGSMGKDWAAEGFKRLQDRQNDEVVLPEYGSEAHITKPRK